jgi:Iap family predicted aminopeptidase
VRRLTALLLTAAAAAATATPASAAVGPADLEPHVRAFGDIAAANGGNRAAGLPGYDRSADYVAGVLQAAGWRVTRQPVRFPFFEERQPPVLHTAVPGRDVVTTRFSGSGDVTGRVRTVLARRCTRRAFRAIRRGDVALVPLAECTYRRAALTAQREGAVAVVFDAGPQTFPLTATLSGPGVRIPAVAARTTTAIRLSRARTPVRVRVDGASSVRVADNVIGELPGGRSVLMAGGHLDSVPEGPGINDNASGSALLLELAERLRAAPRRRATVRLAFWTAEEYGLFGSRHYVRSLPRAERRRFTGYLNFDMVGSPRAVPEVYRGSPRIARALRRGLRRARTVDLAGASDDASFLAAGIPVGGVYTGSLEPGPNGRGFRDRCYHRRCDGPANVNLGVAARVASAAERAMVELARR